jgi:hypothetical protein
MGGLRVVLGRDLTVLYELRQPHPVGIEAGDGDNSADEIQASNTESRRSPALQKTGQACRGGYFRPVISHTRTRNANSPVKTPATLARTAAFGANTSSGKHQLSASTSVRHRCIHDSLRFPP